MARAKPTHACFTLYVTPKHKIPHSFPVDMLRRDHCVPRTEQDAHMIEAAIRYDLDRVDTPPLVIGLVRFYPVGGAAVPTIGRWESFGWRMLNLAETEMHTGNPVEEISGYFG